MIEADIKVPVAKTATEVCIHNLIKTQAERSPDTPAIAAPGRNSVSYRRLADHIDKVVQTLNSFGIGRDDVVAIVLPNGPEMAVLFLAVSSCATCAPLNPAYRANEFDFFLKDLKAKALIIQKGLESPVRDIANAECIPIIELSPLLEEEAGIFKLEGDKISHAVNSGYSHYDDRALVLHTSGTTSRPKIVPLTSINIYKSAHNIQTSLKLAENDICLNIMPLFHIHGLIGAVLSTIIAGATVVCTDGFSESHFFIWLKEFHPTWYTAVPTMHQAILTRTEPNSDILERCPLRFIRSCSSPLPPRVYKDLETAFRVPVIESYGMTEAAHQMASNPLPPATRKIGSVGLPAGPEVSIMDEGGHLMPSEAIGEIVIRGENVISGYENNQEANRSSFTEGWFRTGDQGYFDSDGYLFITGRIKEIINRGGEKISPREIDEALMEHPDVAQVVTFAVPHATIGEDVAAAVVLRENACIPPKDLRAFSFSRLASFKVPSQIIFTNEIPKGPTGKIQRIGLADKLTTELKTEFATPSNAVEEVLVTIWGEVLSIQQLGVNDNFFYIGGDSLLAVKVVSRIRSAFGIELPLEKIFEEPTVAEQAQVIEDLLLTEIEALTDEEAHRLNG
jgi:oxalate---CoA ligase